MYRLLIVDNEPPIVEGLAHLVDDHPDLDIEVYKAFSAADALKWLARTKIDIVLLDIRMPGMSGLELQKEIVEQWPRCRVIFLTGYNDFEYIQKAIRNGSLDYLLKTDGDDKIIDAIMRAIDEIRVDQTNDLMLEMARQQLRVAAPVLQREFLSNILLGAPGSLRQLSKHFKEMGIQLKEQEEVFLVIGSVNDWAEELAVSDQSLLLYAFNNIAEEFLSASAVIHSIILNRTTIVCFVQPQAGKSWTNTTRFVNGTLENVQDACDNMLRLSVSLASSAKPVAWREVSAQYEALSMLLSRGMLSDRRRLLIQGQASDQSPDSAGHAESMMRVHLNRFEEMERLLEQGMESEFLHCFDGLVDNLKGTSEPHLFYYRLEVTHKLIAMFIAFINRWNIQDKVSEHINLFKLHEFSQVQDWHQATSYCRSLARLLFSMKSREDQESSERIVSFIEHFVRSHLDEDLSLTRLGEVAGYNPSYLSRYYKQVTGIGLSEYIRDQRIKKAKELLLNGTAIGDISAALGFLSEPYFYRFFKKMVGMTPQEFRAASK